MFKLAEHISSKLFVVIVNTSSSDSCGPSEYITIQNEVLESTVKVGSNSAIPDCIDEFSIKFSVSSSPFSLALINASLKF